MMVLIGVSDTNVKNGQILDSKCPKCDSPNSLDFSIYRRYTHLTLIPLFPVGKYVNIQCSNCNEFFDYDDLNEQSQLQLKKEKIKSPLWMYSGCILLVLSLLFFVNNYLEAKDKSAIYLENPTVGDIYHIKFSNGYYSTMRIDQVTKDSIYTVHNDFEAYLPYEIKDIDKQENYSKRKINYSKTEIEKLYKEGEIIEISRN
jgi:predicted nucleic-acid-binding Zn-ribbon protein